MSTLLSTIYTAFAKIRPWPVRLEISPQLLAELHKQSTIDDWDLRDFNNRKFRGVLVKVRPHLIGWRLVGESRQAVRAAFVSDKPVRWDHQERPPTVHSDDFDEAEALKFEAWKRENEEARRRHAGGRTP